MNKHQKLIEQLLLDEISSHGFELQVLESEKSEGYVALMNRVVRELEKKHDALNWLRSLPCNLES